MGFGSGPEWGSGLGLGSGSGSESPSELRRYPDTSDTIKWHSCISIPVQNKVIECFKQSAEQHKECKLACQVLFLNRFFKGG